MFSLELSVLTLSLLGVMLLAGVVVLCVLLPKLSRVTAATRPADGEDNNNMMLEYPAVSVIVHSRSDASTLRTLIPMIMQQEYPAPMEVIVVNDGGDDAVTDVVGYFENEYRNLYMTFAPARSRNLSRKKLSITLGIKAARYETVVLLAGNTLLTSPSWLKLMMTNIALGKEIVTGYGYVVTPEDVTPGRHRMMAFDQVRTSVQYLSAAMSGNLYRSFPGNIAYRRQLFYDNKGFSGSLNLRWGDDDIFVSSIAGKRNYAVELAEESMVQVVEENPVMMHRLDKIRHDFTGKFVSKTALYQWGMASTLWWVMAGCGIGAIVTGLPSLVPAIAVTVIALILCLPLMLMWRKASVALHNRKLMLTVPFMMWMHPFYSLVYKIMGLRHREKNYTWSEFQ